MSYFSGWPAGSVVVGATTLLHHLGFRTWWLLPTAIALLLAHSLRRATSEHD